MAAQMSEMNDEVSVHGLSSRGVLAVCTIGCGRPWISPTLTVIGPPWLQRCYRGRKNQFFLLCVDTGRIEPQMFHLQQLPQNNALWIFNNQARGKLMGDRSKLPTWLVRLRRWLQKREGEKNVLRGPNRLCCLLKSQSCYFPTAGLHPHQPSSVFPSCVCTWLRHWRRNSSCLTSSAIVQPRASQGRGRRLFRAEPEPPQSACENVTFNIPIQIRDAAWTAALSETFILWNLQDPQTTECPSERGKRETNNIKQGFLCWDQGCFFVFFCLFCCCFFSGRHGAQRSLSRRHPCWTTVLMEACTDSITAKSHIYWSGTWD